MVNLEKYIKRYIWDDERTPYLVPVARMTRRQADYELHAYTVFIGVLFAIVGAGALLSQDPLIRSDAVAVYSLSVVCAAVVLGFTRLVYPAWYCAAAPLVALLYFFVYGFHPNLQTIDHVALIIFALVWLRYSLRVVVIARAYPNMPEANDQR
jgi:hypothetical protein